MTSLNFKFGELWWSFFWKNKYMNLLTKLRTIWRHFCDKYIDIWRYHFKQTVLRAQEVFLAHLLICCRYLYVLSIFWRKNFSEHFFLTKNRSKKFYIGKFDFFLIQNFQKKFKISKIFSIDFFWEKMFGIFFSSENRKNI